jgi:hypothetical protein
MADIEVKEDLRPGKLLTLAKGEKVGQSLVLYGGGVILPETFGQVIELAQMMCKAGLAIPKHLRDQPGACMAVIQRSLAWQIDPWAVATKTYAVNDIIAYEAQLIAAVVMKWAPIKERVIVPKYAGEGQSLQCSFTVHHRETGEEIPYTSPKVGVIKVKNSPLWTADPEQQLFYYSIRAMARRYWSGLLLGVYDPEEARAMKDITPKRVDNMLEDEPIMEREATASEHDMAGSGEESVVQAETSAPLLQKEPQGMKPSAIKSFWTADDHGTANMTDDGAGLIAKMQPVTDLSDPEDQDFFFDAQDPTPEEIVANMLASIKNSMDAKSLNAVEAQINGDIDKLPKPLGKRVRKALSDRYFDVEDL